MITYNLAAIEEGYRHFFQEAISNGVQHLPYYEIQPWDKVLNEVEQRIFHDIRAIGLPLYPIFPVAPGTYLHFANPFLRLGIEIAYKEGAARIADRKRMLLKTQRWTVYTLESQYCYLTLEDFFHTKRTNDTVEWEDLKRTFQLRFFEKFHRENMACLLQYIKYLHFEKEYV